MPQRVESDKISVANEGGTENEDEGEEEEEILVHVEFDCDVDPGTFNADHTFKIIGIDNDNPLMQVGDKVFQGEWRDTIGTSVFFEEDEKRKSEMVHDDPLFSKNIAKPLKYACCTRKSLVMSRVFVKPKTVKQPPEEPERMEGIQNESNENKENSTQMEC